MKRHLLYFAACTCLTPPLEAQEPYYPSYGYNPDAGYETDDATRQFNFNPGDMMNRMGNPMRGLFGSSNQRYDDYPSGGYPPPAYGYPAYPGYQAPYTGYGYAPQVPPSPGYPPVAPPVDTHSQARPAPQPARPYSPYETPNPAASNYQPSFTHPDQASRYQFRPMEVPASPSTAASTQPVPPEPEPVQEQTEATPSASVYRESQPLAPLTYPQNDYNPEPLAPLSYPEAQPPTSPQVEPRDTQAPEDPNLRFRPLDKPGYSSELGQ